MFEKEAEARVRDYIIKSRDCLMQPCKTLEDCKDKELEFDEVVKLVKEGAEFGYKLAHEEIDYLNKHWRSEEERKANEWHYVSKEGLPKESGRYLVYVGGGENGVYPLDFDTEANDFGYWCLDVGDNLGVRDTIFETVTERNEDKVIAWKEIVLPKESE